MENSQVLSPNRPGRPVSEQMLNGQYKGNDSASYEY